MEKTEMEKLVREAEDYIHSPKHQNSLNKFLTKTENPCENPLIGRLLLISEEEVERLYQESIAEFRREMVYDEAELRSDQ